MRLYQRNRQIEENLKISCALEFSNALLISSETDGKQMLTKIDIISDPNCPFCALGVLQLQKAMREMSVNAPLQWHPFLINPHAPPEGLDIRENLKNKYGIGEAEIEAQFDRFKMQGEALGFDYEYPPGKKVYPSDRAHEFVAWAPDNKKTESYFALMRKFFSESKSFYDLEVLGETARELGLDERAARLAIESGEFAEQVSHEVQYWQAQGIQGVPSFIFNDQYFLSGAIGVEGFKQAFLQIDEAEKQGTGSK